MQRAKFVLFKAEKDTGGGQLYFFNVGSVVAASGWRGRAAMASNNYV